MSASSGSSDPKRCGSSAPPAPAHRRGDALSLLGSLTQRDRYLVDLLAEHQVLTTPQVAQLAFPSLGTAQRRLARLYRLGVLDRFRWHLPVGSASWHYTLGPKGAMLVAAARGVEPPRPGQVRHQTLRIAASPRLAHLLGCNGLFIALAAQAREQRDTALLVWWSEKRCTEYYGKFVRPDAYGTWSENGQRVEFFIEYDTGSEPLSRLATKLDSYADLALAGGPTYPVLFWLPSTTREAHLQRLLRGGRPTVPLATTAADLAAAHDLGPAGPIWLLTAADRRRRLIGLVAPSSL